VEPLENQPPITRESVGIEKIIKGKEVSEKKV